VRLKPLSYLETIALFSKFERMDQNPFRRKPDATSLFSAFTILGGVGLDSDHFYDVSLDSYMRL
jgi:hypothetical protein